MICEEDACSRKNSFLIGISRGLNFEQLTEDTDKASWHQVINSDNIDDKVENFNTLLHWLMDKHAPLKTVNIKHNATPCMTD